MPGFPAKNFNSASHSTMVENVDLIKGIFSHFNLDMRTHCKYSPPPAEDHEELEELPAEAPAEQVGGEFEETLEEIIENPEALPDEFIFEASVENHDALHANVEDMEGLEGQEDDLPEPEKAAVVQVIVNRRKRKNVEEPMARTTNKRTKKVPAKFLQ